MPVGAALAAAALAAAGPGPGAGIDDATPGTPAGALAASVSSGVPAASAPSGGAPAVSDVRYVIAYDSASASRGAFEVAMSFRVATSAPVVLSLPAWTPGSYELDEFARHVRGFTAERDGRAVRWDKTDWDSWRLHPEGPGVLTVRFEYPADTLDSGMAWSTPDFAYFNGTNVFLYPEGQGLGFSSRVTIRTEAGWRVATGMTPAGGANEFRAADYHELVDMPTFVGRFDLDSARVDGHRYCLATYPPGALAEEARERTWDHIRRMMPPMSDVFGETPWERYTILMVFSERFGGASALEHSNSHLGLYDLRLAGHPLVSLITAHEIFHAWNVKRLRPHDLVPYRYDAAQPTTLLWVSEGITDYYADLALVRGGIGDERTFYDAIARKIGAVAAAPPVALEDASLTTWIEPTDGTAFLYYPKGSLAGLLLDILIRDASDNAGSLDGVMRDLYRSAYGQGRGFTEGEWWQAVREMAGGRSFGEFAARYVDGRDPLPWAEVLPLAGLVLAADTARTPRIGVVTEPAETGVTVATVVPGSTAAKAGVRAGDVLVRVGEIEVSGDDFGEAFRRRYADRPAGTPYVLVVRRDGETVELPARLQLGEEVSVSVREDPAASPKAARIRRSLLEGTEGGG